MCGQRVLSRLLAAGALALLPMAASGQQAVVRSYDAPDLEVGQAWLARSGERCLAIMPLHVARETSVPSLLREGDGGLRGEATSVADLGDDAAVAFLSGNIADDCGFALGSISRAVERLLRDGGIGSLRTVNGDGTLGRLAVAVIDDDGERFLRVLPTSPDERIRKGQSGSLLLVNDQPVGMLLSVHSRSGVGTVMRSDVLLGKVEVHLRGGGVVASSPRSPGGGADPATPASQERPAGTWRVTAWNVDPIGSAHTAATLAAAGTDGFWAARVARWPAALELGGPEEIRLVRGVRFLAGEVADAGDLPGQVQVLTSVNAQRPAWRVAGSGSLEFKDGEATIEFLPARARFVRVEIYRAVSAGAQIAVGRVQVLEDAR
ncbi:MAG: hypothetical protein RIC56_14930 [Pseudomonadales bacterium]